MGWAGRLRTRRVGRGGTRSRSFQLLRRRDRSIDLLYNNLPGFGTLHSLSSEIRCNDCTRSTVVRRHTDTFAPRLGRSERTNKQPTSSAMVTARIPVRALAARRKGSWLLVDIGHCFQNLAKALFNRNRPELLRAAQYARAKTANQVVAYQHGQSRVSGLSGGARRNHPAVNDTAAASPSHRFID
jgi:hypothetical protein